MITLTANIKSNINTSFLKSVSSNYPDKYGKYSINKVLGKMQTPNFYVGESFSDDNGNFEWEGVLKQDFSVQQSYTGFRYAGFTEMEYRFFLFGVFTTLNDFKENDYILFDRIKLLAKNKNIIATYPSTATDNFRLEPIESLYAPEHIQEGFQIMLYIKKDFVEQNGLEFSDIEEMLQGSTFYCEGHYERSVDYSNYLITLTTSTELTEFWVSFDLINGGYPTHLKVDGKDYYPASSVFYVSNLNGADTHTIELIQWSYPNSRAVISGIYGDVNLNVGLNVLKSLNCEINDRSNLKFYNWGIISNTGNIEFADFYGQILSFAENLKLSSNLPCEIILTDTLTGKTEIVGTFETDQWDYDNDNKLVKVSLKDDLQEWQEINVEAVSYNPQTAETKTAKWFFNYLWTITSKRYDRIKQDYGKGNYNFVSFSELDSKTQTILESITIKYPLLEAGSFWASWNKLCQLCQAHIYKDRNGIIRFQYNWGN